MIAIGIIIIILTSGCLTTTQQKERTYYYQSDPTKVPNYNYTLILHADGTFLFHGTETRPFNNVRPKNYSGVYSETSDSIIIPSLDGAVYRKKGFDLIDKDGDTWLGT